MKTRPGIDRIDKQTLTASKAWLTGRTETHVKQCKQCSEAGTNQRAHCDTWWRLQRKLHTVRRKLRNLDQPDTAGMDMLPGMEDQ